MNTMLVLVHSNELDIQRLPENEAGILARSHTISNQMGSWSPRVKEYEETAVTCYITFDQPPGENPTAITVDLLDIAVIGDWLVIMHPDPKDKFPQVVKYFDDQESAKKFIKSGKVELKEHYRHENGSTIYYSEFGEMLLLHLVM